MQQRTRYTNERKRKIKKSYPTKVSNFWENRFTPWRFESGNGNNFISSKYPYFGSFSIKWSGIQSNIGENSFFKFYISPSFLKNENISIISSYSWFQTSIIWRKIWQRRKWENHKYIYTFSNLLKQEKLIFINIWK
jgi:hypothetical protein